MTTYCILNSDSVVVTTFANSQQPTIQIGYREMPVDGGQPGQLWNGTAFVPGPTPVPRIVSPAQMMGALSKQTYYQTVMTYINSLPVDQQYAFNRATYFDRDDALINSLAVNIPLTGAQIDSLFVAAAAITV